MAASSAGGTSGWAGSSMREANSTARHAASGRRAHHKCRVEGWPCRIDFSRADSRLIASSGSATSISFRRYPVMLVSPSPRSRVARRAASLAPEEHLYPARKDELHPILHERAQDLQPLAKLPATG